jgi:hypothetical protein
MPRVGPEARLENLARLLIGPVHKSVSPTRRISGYALRSKKPDAQKRDVLIAAGVINKRTALGMPQSLAVAA